MDHKALEAHDREDSGGAVTPSNDAGSNPSAESSSRDTGAGVKSNGVGAPASDGHAREDRSEADNGRAPDASDGKPETSDGKKESANGGGEQAGGSDKETQRKRPPRWLFIAAGILLLIILPFGIRWFHYNSTHVGTDDAQVSGDVYAVSAKVSGYLTSVTANMNALVHKGDVLATIDPQEFQSALSQAQANLQSLIAAARASGAQVKVTRQTAGAGVNQAEAAQTAAQANVTAAQTKLTTAEAGVKAAQSAVRASMAADATARQGIASAEAQVKTATSQLASAKAAEALARANQNKAASDAHRMETLFRQGAISAQQNVAAQTTLATSNAQVDQAIAGVNAAQNQIGQARASALGAQSAAAQAAAGVQTARVGVLQATDQVGSAKAAVDQAIAQAAGAHAALESARSAPAQVSVTTSTAASNAAKIAQAQAAVDEAQLQLSYTVLKAPADGYVSQKNVEPGQLVQPGQELMDIVPLKSGIYVVANLKETQLTNVRLGQSVDVTVDAYPGHVFKGTVQSIASSTGATFSLLPPENATGNFVKVVQRVPVKVVIDVGADPDRVLRLGMSVNVSIATG